MPAVNRGSVCEETVRPEAKDGLILQSAVSFFSHPRQLQRKAWFRLTRVKIDAVSQGTVVMAVSK